MQQEKMSAPPVYFTAEFQLVAVVLMWKVSRRSKKGQMNLQVNPSKTYCINAGSFAAASEITFALSVATTWVGRRRPISHRDVIVDNWQRGCLITQEIQREMARKSNSLRGNIVEECSQHNTNLKVTQSIQHGIPHVVLRGTQSSPQTRMWKRWRTFLLQKCYQGQLQRATPLPDRETNCHLTQN